MVALPQHIEQNPVCTSFGMETVWSVQQAVCPEDYSVSVDPSANLYALERGSSSGGPALWAVHHTRGLTTVCVKRLVITVLV